MAASLEAQDSLLQDILIRNDLKIEDLNKECPQSIMYDIAIKIDDWETTGYFLYIPKEKLAAIKENKQTAQQCRVALVTTWHECHGKNATYLMLMTAFHKLGRHDLVDALCSMIKSHSMAYGIQHQSSETG